MRDHEDPHPIRTIPPREKGRECSVLILDLSRAHDEIRRLEAEVAALRARLEAALSPVVPES